MRIAVTGATGLVGSHLTAELNARGHEVVALTRPRFVLGQPVAASLLRGCDALVHCAYDFQAFGWDEVRRSNVDGTAALLAAAAQAGVSRLAFVSTLSAFEGCRSVYGRGKLAVEALVRETGGVSLRPGLIYGDAQGRGMVGALTRALKAPVVPLFGNGQFPFYLCHVQDLARLLADVVVQPESWRGRVVAAAHPKPVLFRDLLNQLSQRELGRPLRALPVPVGLGMLLLKTAEGLGLRPGFRSDSLVGMVHFDPAPPFSPELATERQFRAFS